MKIVCPSCNAVYNVPAVALPKIKAMGELQCSQCGNKWVPNIDALLRELEQRKKASSPQQPRKIDFPSVSPLDKEVAVDWSGEKRQNATRNTQQKQISTQSNVNKFGVRPSRAPQSRQSMKQHASFGGQKKSPEQTNKNFSFGKNRMTANVPAGQGFTDKEDVSVNKKNGFVTRFLSKIKFLDVIKDFLITHLDRWVSREKLMTLLRKEQFWTWAWLASFAFLVILFFLAYLNWDSILHAWPPASRIYHPD